MSPATGLCSAVLVALLLGGCDGEARRDTSAPPSAGGYEQTTTGDPRPPAHFRPLPDGWYETTGGAAKRYDETWSTWTSATNFWPQSVNGRGPVAELRGQRILISVLLTRREPFPASSPWPPLGLPLRLTDAVRAHEEGAPHVVQYRLQRRGRQYDVDVRIDFAREPDGRRLVEAQRMLDRLQLPRWRATPDPSAARDAVYAIDETGLTRLDGETLAAVAGPVPLAGHSHGWSFAPDARTLVAGKRGASLRFVDLAAMRVVDDVRLQRRGAVVMTSWLDNRRVVAFVHEPGCCVGRATAYIVDASTRRVVARRALPGSIQAAEALPREVVVLLGPRRGLGRSRLAAIDRAGKVRTVALAEVVSGGSAPPSGRTPGREARPGLAVDAAARRAFVVMNGLRIATVDLARMQVRYRAVKRPASLLGRLRDWLEPPARADIAPEGTVHRAAWLGGGRIAVSGEATRYEGGRAVRAPLGLTLTDTRDWSARTIDATAVSFSHLGGAVVVSGVPGRGVRVYARDGRERFRLFNGRRAFVQLIAADRAYVTLSGEWPKASVVDVRSGKLVGRERLRRALYIAPRQKYDVATPWDVRG